MSKYVNVIDNSPSANKKGLRIKVKSVELDENNNLLALNIDYSGWHERGFARVETAQGGFARGWTKDTPINIVDLPEE